MKEAAGNQQLEIPMLEYVFAKVAHVRRFVQPNTKHQARFDHS